MAIRDAAFRATFSRLFVYNILFEDAEVDESVLELDDASSVFAISAAGCGVAGMLSRHPTSIDAIDINRHHLALTALKVAASRYLTPYEDFYALLGHGHADRPRTIVPEVATTLPRWMQRYWKRHASRFRKSLYTRGLTARMLRFMRKASGMDRDWLLEMIGTSVEERAAAVEARLQPLLDKRVVRAFVKSPAQLVTLGINYEQRDKIVETSGGDLISFFIDHMKRVAATDLETNWFAWYSVVGEFNHEHPEAVPPYLRRDRYEAAQEAPTRMRYHRASVFDVLSQAGPDEWSHYTLCDAPDWMPRDMQRALLNEILRTSRDGALVLSRSVEGDCWIEHHGMDRHFQCVTDRTDWATAQDRSRQYRRVSVHQVCH